MTTLFWRKHSWLFINYLVLYNIQPTVGRSQNTPTALNNRAEEIGFLKIKYANGSRGDVVGTDKNVMASNVGEVVAQKSVPIGQEPSCEQLRAMWIFSKRQSRAAEVTNEIPTFRDPFVYNVWEPIYPKDLHVGATRWGSGIIQRNRFPVFGKIISREPILQQRINLSQRKPEYNSDTLNPRLFGTETKTTFRKPPKNRHLGRSNGFSSSINSANTPEPNGAFQGSFQKLKELIWTERAMELTQQRKAEEMAAKAAVLKEITNGKNLQQIFKIPLTSLSESPLMDENRSPDDGLKYTHNFESQIENKDINPFEIHKNINTRQSPGYGFAQLNKNSNKSSIKTASDQSSYEPPKMYPFKSSHFRERNRVLFKQMSPKDLFRRFRKQSSSLLKDYRKNTPYYSTNSQIDIDDIVLGEILSKIFVKNETLFKVADPLFSFKKK